MRTSEQIRTAKDNILRWKNSRYTDLYSAYGKCSAKKREAWRYCQELCEKYKGDGLKIISRNDCRFTAGFVYPDFSTGELMFMYISPSYNQSVSLAV